MKIEPKSIPKPKKHNFADALRHLDPGEMIRITTPQEWRAVAGSIIPIQRQRGIKFATANDGEHDVLVFIKESPKKV